MYPRTYNKKLLLILLFIAFVILLIVDEEERAPEKASGVEVSQAVINQKIKVNKNVMDDAIARHQAESREKPVSFEDFLQQAYNVEDYGGDDASESLEIYRGWLRALRDKLQQRYGDSEVATRRVKEYFYLKKENEIKNKKYLYDVFRTGDEFGKFMNRQNYDTKDEEKAFKNYNAAKKRLVEVKANYREKIKKYWGRDFKLFMDSHKAYERRIGELYRGQEYTPGVPL